mmetsp:Transcript_20946/g.38415  ORF Transcript_20946/g.38415 Transcript_20946/m.38415 type:complete len:98 (-) Transcript_20946:308-601(-)
MPTLTRPIVPSDVVIAPKIDTFCRLPSSCSHPTHNVGLGPTERKQPWLLRLVHAPPPTMLASIMSHICNIYNIYQLHSPIILQWSIQERPVLRQSTI